MKPLLTFLLLFLLTNSCYNPTPSDTIHDLKVLDGEWQSHKGVKFNENWRYVDENLFEGEGFSLNGVDTVFFELLRIVREGGSIYYKVGLGEQRRGNFILTEASKTSWTFVNPENDFPSIIIYQVKNDSLLLVTTSNIRGNKEQFFYLKKVD